MRHCRKNVLEFPSVLHQNAFEGTYQAALSSHHQMPAFVQHFGIEAQLFPTFCVEPEASLQAQD